MFRQFFSCSVLALFARGSVTVLTIYHVRLASVAVLVERRDGDPRVRGSSLGRVCKFSQDCYSTIAVRDFL